MSFYPTPQAVRDIAVLFDKAPKGFIANAQYVGDQVGITATHAVIAMRALMKRRFLCRITHHEEAMEWTYNPDFQGTLSDALSGFKLKDDSKRVDYPDDFKVAGRAYEPPRSKEPYEKQYFQELMSLKNIAEASRK